MTSISQDSSQIKLSAVTLTQAAFSVIDAREQFTKDKELHGSQVALILYDKWASRWANTFTDKRLGQVMYILACCMDGSTHSWRISVNGTIGAGKKGDRDRIAPGSLMAKYAERNPGKKMLHYKQFYKLLAKGIDFGVATREGSGFGSGRSPRRGESSRRQPGSFLASTWSVDFSRVVINGEVVPFDFSAPFPPATPEPDEVIRMDEGYLLGGQKGTWQGTWQGTSSTQGLLESPTPPDKSGAAHGGGVASPWSAPSHRSNKKGNGKSAKPAPSESAMELAGAWSEGYPDAGIKVPILAQELEALADKLDCETWGDLIDASEYYHAGGLPDRLPIDHTSVHSPAGYLINVLPEAVEYIRSHPGWQKELSKRPAADPSHSGKRTKPQPPSELEQAIAEVMAADETYLSEHWDEFVACWGDRPHEEAVAIAQGEIDRSIGDARTYSSLQNTRHMMESAISAHKRMNQPRGSGRQQRHEVGSVTIRGPVAHSMDEPVTFRSRPRGGAIRVITMTRREAIDRGRIKEGS